MRLELDRRQQRTEKPPARQPAPERKAQQDALLDQALQETFPASDPVSVFEVK